jgi:uncharacterized protein YjbI with pentapeptide repeats
MPRANLGNAGACGAKGEMSRLLMAPHHQTVIREFAPMKLHRVTAQLEVPDADLSGSQFNDANLSGTTFCQINFSGARVNDSNMAGWQVSDVNLSGAAFQNIDLSGATLSNCRLVGVTIDGVPLEEMMLAYQRSKAL